MKNKVIVITMLTTLFLSSCKETPIQENEQKTKSESIEKTTDNIVMNTSTDKDGKKLDLVFNNTKGTVTLNFNGETIELIQQKSGSGIWYKNENYELRGKGNDIELKKDGKLIFEHKDDIVNYSLKNKKGQTLDMTYNNTTNKVKVYLNGGEEIELEGQKAASGIWHKN